MTDDYASMSDESLHELESTLIKEVVKMEMEFMLLLDYRARLQRVRKEIDSRKF